MRIAPPTENEPVKIPRENQSGSSPRIHACLTTNSRITRILNESNNLHHRLAWGPKTGAASIHAEKIND